VTLESDWTRLDSTRFCRYERTMRFLWCVPTTLNYFSNCEIIVMKFHHSIPLPLHHCAGAVAARQTALLSAVRSASSIIGNASLTPSVFATWFYSTVYLRKSCCDDVRTYTVYFISPGREMKSGRHYRLLCSSDVRSTAIGDVISNTF